MKFVQQKSKGPCMFTEGNISLVMGPYDLGAPHELETAIVNFVGQAKKSLDIAVQELESRPIAEAIIRARTSGVRVRIVLESDYLIDEVAAANPFASSGKYEQNRILLNALLRSGINVRMDYNPAIFHQKFMVRDNDVPGQRAVLTGSTNFTPTGTHKNLNHIIIIRNGYVAREYANEFAEIWNGTFGEKRARHEAKPRNSRVSGVRVKALFAPDHSPEMEIMKQMLKARKCIRFAIFTFSKSSGIDDTMIALGSKIDIQGVLDAGQGNRSWAATRPLANAGVQVRLADKRNGLGKLHHKLMVIDRQVIIAGSFNYTDPANTLNDENIIIIGDIDEEKEENRTRQHALAKFAATEIERIMKKHGNKI